MNMRCIQNQTLLFSDIDDAMLQQPHHEERLPQVLAFGLQSSTRALPHAYEALQGVCILSEQACMGLTTHLDDDHVQASLALSLTDALPPASKKLKLQLTPHPNGKMYE